VRAHLLALTGKKRPRVLLVPTASAEDAAQSLRIYDVFGDRAEMSRVEFFPWPPERLRELTLAQDLVLVGGGNTANMLAIWRVHGFDEILREAYEQGVVLAGSSAGMICWFEAGVTDSFGPQLAGLRDGLGFVAGSACPHYDDEELRRPAYRWLIDEEGFPPGYAADSGVGLHFVDGELAEAISGREGATAYRVEPGREEPLQARLV
jgi:dipeptidase E